MLLAMVSTWGISGSLGWTIYGLLTVGIAVAWPAVVGLGIGLAAFALASANLLRMSAVAAVSW
jgi:hypothetical protein